VTVAVLRRTGAVAVVVTYLQLVFGGIVRVTGSGMGCGDHWPKCNGSWIPPFTDPTVMIEWTHRLLALLVLLSAVALAWIARRAGRAGVVEATRVRPFADAALALVIAVALLGMITVKLGNTALATAAHWTLALSLLAVQIVAAVRAGAFGGPRAAAEGGTARAARSLGAGAAFAFLVVVLGGLTAKIPGAAAACPSFPHCGETPAGVSVGASHIHMAHRVVATLLFLHVLAVATAVRRRAGESLVVRRVIGATRFLILAQLALGVMIATTGAPAPRERIAHQATGVAVWMLLFGCAYLARVAARSGAASPAGGA